MMLSAFHRRLPELYVCVALPVTLLLCLITAPFFGPDEPNQAARAITLGHGQLFAEGSDEDAGAQLDSGAVLAMAGMDRIRMRWETGAADFNDRTWGPVRPAEQQALARIRWDGTTSYVEFPNTAAYGPALYLPAMAGWRGAEALDLTIFASLRLARLLNALAAVALGWLALRLCIASRWAVISLLLLPSALFLNATSSQDALLLPCAAVLCALLCRALAAGRDFADAELTGAVLILTAMAMARPPYVGLALLLLLPAAESGGSGTRRWLKPALATGLVVICALLWRRAVLYVGVDSSDEADSALQAAFMAQHPLAAATALLHGTAEAAADLLRRGVYVVGWNDLLAPRALRVAAAGCLVLFALLQDRRRALTRGGNMILLAGVGLPLLGISVAEYFIWTPPGHSTVYGIQPRYWLPVLPFGYVLLQQMPAMPARLRRALLPAAAILFATIAFTLPWVAAHAFYRESLIGVLGRNAF